MTAGAQARTTRTVGIHHRAGVGGVVVAVVDRHGRGPAALRLDLRGLPARTVLLPADRRLAAGRDRRRPSAAQRRGHLLVAAALVDAARTAGGAR